MEKKKKRVEESLERDYAYLISTGYFRNESVSAMGYKSFLRSTPPIRKGHPLKMAWELNEEANSTYPEKPKKAYRMWLESIVLYMEAEKDIFKDVYLTGGIAKFTDRISRYISPKHIRPQKVFITVKLSLEYHQAFLEKNSFKINCVINQAYRGRILIVPAGHIETYIKETLNSIYYN